MLTVQEIQSVNFEKAVFGGYDMKAVDEFLEQVTEDFAALQKENAALKSKMKVLVDKIEEYRSVEEGMRRALVSAQGIAQETLSKAKAEAEQLLVTARNEAETRIEGYRLQIAAEAKKLEDTRAKNSDFVAQLSAVYEDQLKSLVKLSASELLQPQAPLTIASISAEAQSKQPSLDSTQSFSLNPEAAKAEALEKSVDIVEQPAPIKQDTSKFKITEVTLSSSETPEDSTKTQFDFGDLKFGADYKPEEDK